MQTTNTTTAHDETPRCPECRDRGRAIKWGKDASGVQRYRCKVCSKTFAERESNPLPGLRIGVERATLIVSLLSEGMGIRGTSRITGHHQATIIKTLRIVGAKCERLMEVKAHDVKVKNVEADEVWSYVKMKESTKSKRDIHSNEIGDAWTWAAIERESKFLLTWHVGRRTGADADKFICKLDRATAGHFQLTTDGLSSYLNPIEQYLGHRTDYAQLVKTYGEAPKEERRKYSPSRLTGIEKIAIHGTPDEDMICTSIVERSNCTWRQHSRRLNRLTLGFSKRFDCHRAAVAIMITVYNFVRIHSTLKCTPAMAAGVSTTLWSVRDLVAA